MKKALITGINGMDASHLADLLLEKNYEIHGLVRRHSDTEGHLKKIEHIKDKVQLHYGDLQDYSSINDIIKTHKPDEIYNLAAQSHVRISFDMPCYTFQANTVGFLNILEAAKNQDYKVKVYQASTSEMFGNSFDKDGYQRITTPMTPVSPYGCSKLASHTLAINYRNAYDMFVVSGILFNHEGPRRDKNFVTAKIVEGAVKIYKNKQSELFLGNLDASRDWGHAKDYVEAMYLMLQNEKPKDYVVASGKAHTVRYLCNYVFTKLGMNYEDYVKVDKNFLRPEELRQLCGDSSPIRAELGWFPQYTFETLIDEMIEHYLTLH